MGIKVGDALPDVKLKEMGEGGPKDVSIGELTKGRTVVFFAVPGAFTPTCSMKHLPGFVEKSGELRKKGVDEFDHALFGHIGFVISNSVRSFIILVTAGNATFHMTASRMTNAAVPQMISLVSGRIGFLAC